MRAFPNDRLGYPDRMLRFTFLGETGDPLVLPWGNGPALNSLSAVFRGLHRRQKELSLGELDFCEPVAGEQIIVVPSEVGGGMTQVAGSPAQFRWAISLADCDRFADEVDVVAGWQTPCHQYLDDASGGGVTVKVSKDEYTPTFRP